MDRSIGLIVSAIALLGISTVVVAQPARCSSFNDLVASLQEGWAVRTAVEYATRGLLIDPVGQRSYEATGGRSIGTVEFFGRGVARKPKATIAAFETHLIDHPRYGYGLNYVRLRICEDNAVEIVARDLDPTTDRVLLDETFTGAISSGADDHGIHLFRNTK